MFVQRLWHSLFCFRQRKNRKGLYQEHKRLSRFYLNLSTNDEAHLSRADLRRDDHLTEGKRGGFEKGEYYSHEPGDLGYVREE